MSQRPKIATVVTEYRLNAHADVIVGRLLEGYFYEGRRREPRLEVVSMYTDQVPDGNVPARGRFGQQDMSRPMAAKHGFPIAPTVREALTLGTDDLAVDGVVLVGEHGDYPLNEKGQKLYPRYELYEQIIEVFRDTGRVVPVFCDKHLSYEWGKALWMVEQSRELGFPLLAGSVQTQTWRRPPLELELDTPLTRGVSCFYGPKDCYGFHALEILQCMVERRVGGETGLAAVQCLEGKAVWAWLDETPWATRLLDAALERSESAQPGRPRDNCKQPIAFRLEYRSGLEGVAFILNGHIQDRTVALEIPGQDEPLSTLFFAQNERPFGHHSGTAHFIEEMMLHGKAAWPPERTLLTSGALEALFDSSFAGGVRVETPHLAVEYTAPEGSRFMRGPVPPPGDF